MLRPIGRRSLAQNALTSMGYVATLLTAVLIPLFYQSGVREGKESLDAQCKVLESRMADLENDRNELSGANARRDGEIAGLNEMLAGIREELRKCREGVAPGTADADVETLRGNVLELQASAAALKAENRRLVAILGLRTGEESSPRAAETTEDRAIRTPGDGGGGSARQGGEDVRGDGQPAPLRASAGNVVFELKSCRRSGGQVEIRLLASCPVGRKVELRANQLTVITDATGMSARAESIATPTDGGAGTVKLDLIAATPAEVVCVFAVPAEFGDAVASFALTGSTGKATFRGLSIARE